MILIFIVSMTKSSREHHAVESSMKKIENITEINKN